MRLDRAITLHVARPLNALRPRVLKVPILMYHRVPVTDDCKVHPYYCTNTALRVFEGQMRFLHENGYRAVSIAEAYQAVHNPTSNQNEKLVAITFDDGYRDFYTNAFPILTKYGLSATMFLPTGYIGDHSRTFKDSECLTWSEVQELRHGGIQFGSHTVTHPKLHSVTSAQLREELEVSKIQIEQKLGDPVESFCYPYAFPEADRRFVSSLCRVLLETGYRVGVCTIVGTIENSVAPLLMRRLPVNTHDDSPLFRAKLLGGYDWLHKVQYIVKHTSHWRDRGGQATT